MSPRVLILNEMRCIGKGAVDGRKAFNYLNIDFPEDKTKLLVDEILRLSENNFGGLQMKPQGVPELKGNECNNKHGEGAM